MYHIIVKFRRVPFVMTLFWGVSINLDTVNKTNFISSLRHFFRKCLTHYNCSPLSSDYISRKHGPIS